MKRWISLAAVVLLCAGTLIFCTLPGPDQAGASSMDELGLMLLDADGSVSVLAVRDRSPADRAGFLPGDILTAANDTPVQTTEQLENLLQTAMEHGLRFQVQRGSQETPLQLQLNFH